MFTFAHKPRVTHTTTPAPTMPSQAHSGQLREVGSTLHLQRTIGDQDEERMPRADPAATDALAHDFRRIPIHSGAPVEIGTELKINPPGDIYEQEADRVAEQVMRMAEPAAKSQSGSTSNERVNLQRKCACGGSCPDCRSERGDRARITTPPIVHEVLGSAGQPLDHSTRAFMQSRFGHDFSRVRVHADAAAGDSARALNARAYTVGHHVVFSSQEYAPGTAEGRRLLAHELTHTIQQSRIGSDAGPAAPGWNGGAVWPHAPGWTAGAVLPYAPGRLQRKEAVLKPEVTPANPLERLLNGDSDGLTTPFVNGVEISDTEKLDDALPSKLHYTAGSGANTCKVGTPIDVNSQAKIITASAPGPKGWTASASFETVKTVLKVTDRACAAKKGNIDVRMVASMGNKDYATLVRTAEGDHEKVIENNHNKYLKPYHDLVNSKQGSNKDARKCAEGLSKEFRDKEVDAINNWATDWIASEEKLDGKGGPHTSKASAAAVGKCDEVLVTIRR